MTNPQVVHNETMPEFYFEFARRTAWLRVGHGGIEGYLLRGNADSWQLDLAPLFERTGDYYRARNQ